PLDELYSQKKHKEGESVKSRLILKNAFGILYAEEIFAVFTNLPCKGRQERIFAFRSFYG
ncbi:MAG: hypothetical protein LUD51_03225, partial [Clostridia bacterium]|nr:hypothetical protein [Clostridia bacterium]